MGSSPRRPPNGPARTERPPAWAESSKSLLPFVLAKCQRRKERSGFPGSVSAQHEECYLGGYPAPRVGSETWLKAPFGCRSTCPSVQNDVGRVGISREIRAMQARRIRPMPRNRPRQAPGCPRTTAWWCSADCGFPGAPGAQKACNGPNGRAKPNSRPSPRRRTRTA